WSFLLGEVALYCFVLLVLTGIYLTFFFDDSVAQMTYHGSYAPLDGATMTHAYASVLHISFDVKAGLLIRQTHHWAATVCVGANLANLIWDGPCPGSSSFWPRLFIVHVLVLPIVIGGLLAVHLVLVASRHHTQFKRSVRESERRVVGIPAFPGQAPRSIGLM